MGKERVYSYIEEIAMRLKEYRKYGKVSLMVGAGFSKNAISKGMKNVQPPNWNELADKMYCELYPASSDMNDKQKSEWEKQRIIKTSGKNVTKLAEEYIVNFDRNQMNHLIENSIADDLFLPGELHKRLLKLQWEDIFTTNYDTLLERAANLVFRERSYQVICSQNDIPGSIRPRIVKLHGSIPQVKPYIICDEDYRTYPDKYAPMVNTVQQAMLETRLCLIGFSGDDPNFQNWMGWIRDNMGECCPAIYLIGIFDSLSEVERKLLESKQIIIVDISCLVEESEADRHRAAIAKFLELLENYQKEKDIFQDKPYPHADAFWKPEDKNKYIKEIGEYSSRIVEYIQPYVLLPEKVRDKCEKYFAEHFGVLVRQCKEQLPIVEIAEIVKILRKCSIVLEDKNAKGLEEICGHFNNITTIGWKELDALIEIELYLAEMYRIDSKSSEHEKKIALLENLVAQMPCHKNELLIEKIKNRIDTFDYEEAKTLTDEIEESSFEIKVKKAGFYKQLSEYDLADKILSKCSLELAQMKISEDIYASYLGYLNLCYRVNKWRISDEFSDENYLDNPYNTRQIIIKQRDELSQIFFRDNCKEDERMLPFNLNTSKNVTNYVAGESPAYSRSFSYIITLDKLCLPLFGDLARLLPRSYSEIIDSSSCKRWKLSLIARSDNEKIIDQIFTREMLSEACKEDIDGLFYSLISLVNLYKSEDDYFEKTYIISLKNCLNILSRLVVFMSDEAVGQYLKILSKVSRRDDHRIDRDISNILSRIATRFNSDVAKACQDIIFKEFGEQFYLANYFTEFSMDIDKENARSYYQGALQLVSKGNMIERDCGISQLLLLWKNCKLEDLREKIKDAIWDNDVLPSSGLYFPFIWEELPHPDVKFSELYYQYLLEDRFVTSVTEFGTIRTNSLGSVYTYLNFFYATSDMCKRKIEKVNLDENLAVFVLETAYNYMLHEESLLKSVFDKSAAEEKFEYIADLVALVYIGAIHKGFADSIGEKINEIWQLLNENQIVVEAIRIVCEIHKGQYSLCMELFENIVLSKDKRNYKSVFIGIRCLFFYLYNKEDKFIEIEESFEKFMSSIKYLDVEYAKTVWIQLEALITQDFFMNTKAQKYISSAIQKCIELYNGLAQKGQRFYMDGLYNCISTLRDYYDRIIESDVTMTQELRDCVAVAKDIENYEIRNIWS
jgi:hypothetical protein